MSSITLSPLVIRRFRSWPFRSNISISRDYYVNLVGQDFDHDHTRILHAMQFLSCSMQLLIAAEFCVCSYYIFDNLAAGLSGTSLILVSVIDQDTSRCQIIQIINE